MSWSSAPKISPCVPSSTVFAFLGLITIQDHMQHLRILIATLLRYRNDRCDCIKIKRPQSDCYIANWGLGFRIWGTGEKILEMGGGASQNTSTEGKHRSVPWEAECVLWSIFPIIIKCFMIHSSVGQHELKPIWNEIHNHNEEDDLKSYSAPGCFVA